MLDENKAHYVSVTGIVIKDGKFLITKWSANEKAFPSLWTVPGGKLEKEDYIKRPADTSAGQWYNICEDIVRREVLEETGIKIRNIKYLASLVFIRPDGIPVVVISLYGDYAGGEVKLSEESIDYAWVNLEEAMDYKMIDGIFEELEMLDKVLKGSKVVEWGEKINKDELLTEKIRKYVEDECKKPESKYGYECFESHFIPTVKYAKLLAERLNANAEIVELAAWLHDIGSIIYGRENHHITWSKVADKKLNELGYEKEKIERVKECIFAHRGSKYIERKSIEAQIIAEADAINYFDDIGNLIWVVAHYEKKDKKEALCSVKDKVINSFEKLSDSAKEIVRPKFEAAMLLLN